MAENKPAPERRLMIERRNEPIKLLERIAELEIDIDFRDNAHLEKEGEMLRWKKRAEQAEAHNTRLEEIRQVPCPLCGGKGCDICCNGFVDIGRAAQLLEAKLAVLAERIKHDGCPTSIFNPTAAEDAFFKFRNDLLNLVNDLPDAAKELQARADDHDRLQLELEELYRTTEERVSRMVESHVKAVLQPLELETNAFYISPDPESDEDSQ